MIKMRSVTIIFNKAMKMSDLIDADYNLLLLLIRLNINLGFGDKKVEEVCAQYNMDPDCFIFLANFQSNRSILDVEKVFESLPLESFISYLKTSHAYFLENRLPDIKRKLKKVFSEDKVLENLVLGFFADYTQEIYEHMTYEDEVVFPYVNSLLSSSAEETYSIDMFEERHNNIEDKMRDLKLILMKYVDRPEDRLLMTKILMELYTLEEELSVHTYIEDELIIPRVRRLEKNRN